MLHRLSNWLLLLLLSGCGQAQSSASAAIPAYQTKKFELSAGPCTAGGYPATILEGRFLNSLGGSFPVPYGHTLDGNWGRSGIAWSVERRVSRQQWTVTRRSTGQF